MTTSQKVTIGGAFVAVVVLIAGSTYFLSSTEYVPLFAELDPEAANDLVTKLKARKIPYQLDPGGRGIRVPAANADELKIEFASQGLPSSGRIGFEIFDRTAFGATEFLEQVNFRRALEGELGRTITTIAEISGARVHITPAKTSLFGQNEQPATASVLLRLKSPNRPLSGGTVRGITTLVAAAIEGLRADAVVIMDSTGRTLTKPAENEDGALDGVQLERQQRIERDLKAKVVSLLEPVVGADRVRVDVSARMMSQSREETEERWDPGAAVVRSKQTTQDGTTGGPQAGGVAGARANLPPTPPPAGTPNPPPQPVAGATTQLASFGGASRSAETTNYEISRLTRHTIAPKGDVSRLSVAVIVDNEPVVKKDSKGVVTRSTRSRQPAEMQKIQGIVAAAVGFDQTRGDQITVENVSFDTTGVEEPAPQPFMEKYAPMLTELSRVFVVLVLGLLTFLFVVRPLLRRSMPAPLPTVTVETQALPQQLPRTVEELQGELEAQLEAAEAKATEPRKMTVLTKRLASTVQKEPEHAARLLRTWLAEGEER